WELHPGDRPIQAARWGNWKAVRNGFDKPIEIRKGNTRIQFFYGPDKARFKQVKTVGDKVTVTWYIGKLYERVASDKKLIHKDYIGIGHATLIREKTGTQVEYKYLFKDHLGSTDVVTDATGKVVERSSFAPFGERRLANWRDPGSRFLTSSQTTRGYTGHEQLDEVGLIHMNGRVYDPELGRFLSPDPNVQAPLNSQNLNRYSYVLNNPLSYTDPSGFFFDKLGDLIQDLASNPIVRSVAMIGCSVGTQGTMTAVCAGVMTAAFTKAAGGSWDDALQAGAVAAVSSAIAGGIGDLQQHGVIGTFEAAALHGLSQGALAAAQGGNFAANFSAAAFSKVASPQVSRLSGGTAVHVIAMAVIGGTTSAITGGKFANGAMSSAFVYLFNDQIHRREMKHVSYDIVESEEESKVTLRIFYKGKLVGKGDFDPFSLGEARALSGVIKAIESGTFAWVAKNLQRMGQVFTIKITTGSQCGRAPACVDTEGKNTIYLKTGRKGNIIRRTRSLFRSMELYYPEYKGNELLDTYLTWDIAFMHELGHVFYDALSTHGYRFPGHARRAFYADAEFADEYFSVGIENIYRAEMYPADPTLNHRDGYRFKGDLELAN
ncbi:hypothetical protein D6833_03565, partial [Candidatus Parcubacteria bacterium]